MKKTAEKRAEKLTEGKETKMEISNKRNRMEAVKNENYNTNVK